MDILDILLDILLKPPQPFIGLFLFYGQLFIVCSNSNETHRAKLHNVFSISLCLVVLVVQVTLQVI